MIDSLFIDLLFAILTLPLQSQPSQTSIFIFCDVSEVANKGGMVQELSGASPTSLFTSDETIFQWHSSWNYRINQSPTN